MYYVAYTHGKAQGQTLATPVDPFDLLTTELPRFDPDVIQLLRT